MHTCVYIYVCVSRKNKQSGRGRLGGERVSWESSGSHGQRNRRLVGCLHSRTKALAQGGRDAWAYQHTSTYAHARVSNMVRGSLTGYATAPFLFFLVCCFMSCDSSAGPFAQDARVFAVVGELLRQLSALPLAGVLVAESGSFLMRKRRSVMSWHAQKCLSKHVSFLFRTGACIPIQVCIHTHTRTHTHSGACAGAAQARAT